MEVEEGGGDGVGGVVGVCVCVVVGGGDGGGEALVCVGFGGGGGEGGRGVSELKSQDPYMIPASVEPARYVNKPGVRSRPPSGHPGH